MLYPRCTHNGKLVSDDQMVSTREHLSQSHRMLFMTGNIGGETESHNLLMALDSLSHDPVRLVISSYGGNLDSTFLLYDTIKLVRSPVDTLGRYCASAAALLLAAGRKRYLFPHAKVMLHLPSSYFERVSLDTEDMGIMAQESKKYKDRMIDLLIECGAKKTRKEILRDINREYWLEPDEAIAYGLADEIATPQLLEDWLR